MLSQGDAWPYSEESYTLQQYYNYYCSDDVFVCRRMNDSTILGTFYIKPNYPGRCNHICNGGFITHPNARGLGIPLFLLSLC